MKTQFWPRSLPDYRWPAEQRTVSKRLQSLAGSVLFHAAHAAGRIANLALGSRGRAMVIRTDGIGDAVLFEPTLETIARTISPRRVHLWAPAATCELMRLCPFIRKFNPIPRGGKPGNLTYRNSFYWRAKLGFQLGRWSFDAVYHLAESPEPFSNWLFTQCRAKERWCNWGDTVNQFEQQRAANHAAATRVLEARPGNAHELTRNQYLMSQWSPQPADRTPKIHLSDSVNRQADVAIEAWRAEARQLGATTLIGLVPQGAASVNRYEVPKWTQVLRRLWNEENAVALLIGGPEQSETLAQLRRELKSGDVPFLDLQPPLSLLGLSALVKRLDAMLCVDTGIAHIAVAQGVRTVVLSAGGNPNRFFPWPNAEHHTALTVDMPCTGCNNRCVKDQSYCLTTIEPHDVVGAMSRLLHPERVEEQQYVPMRVAG